MCAATGEAHGPPSWTRGVCCARARPRQLLPLRWEARNRRVRPRLDMRARLWYIPAAVRERPGGAFAASADRRFRDGCARVPSGVWVVHGRPFPPRVPPSSPGSTGSSWVSTQTERTHGTRARRQGDVPRTRGRRRARIGDRARVRFPEPTASAAAAADSLAVPVPGDSAAAYVPLEAAPADSASADTSSVAAPADSASADTSSVAAPADSVPAAPSLPWAGAGIPLKVAIPVLPPVDAQSGAGP